MPMDLDETPQRSEHPALAGPPAFAREGGSSPCRPVIDPAWKDAYILAADTVVAVGRRILPKAEQIDEASNALYLLSGRNHRVFTGICLVTPDHTIRQKIVETRVRFKRLSRHRDRKLPGLGPVARQGRRLCHPGPGRQLSWSSWSAPTPMSSACRSTRPSRLLTGEGYDVHYKWLEG
jgi:septum formation protein